MTMMIVNVLTLLLLLSVSTKADSSLAHFCNGSNYTANSAFQSSLSLLLSALSSSNATFTTDAVGSGPDRAYGLVLCRGDAGPTDCLACIQNAAQDVVSSLCPVSRQATVWYDDCELRYADFSFFSAVDDSSAIIMWNVNNATNTTSFVEMETKLVDEVARAAAFNSTLKFATGIAINGTGSPVLYALAQCTRDLSTEGCGACLQQIRGYYTSYAARMGGRVLGRSCNFRYESYQFFGGHPTVSIDLSLPPPPPPAAAPLPPPPPPPSSAPDNEQGSKKMTSDLLQIAIPIGVGVAFLGIVGICFWRRRHVKKVPIGMMMVSDTSSFERLSFNLPMLKVATDNFSDKNKLGQGGFGSVYKGTLENGEEIAVKRLSASSRQGVHELKNELILVAKLQHKNLVRLLGVCLEEDEKLLVYEFVSNGSLDNFLFDPAKCKELNWEIRFRIIRGIAQGLLYLHEESHLKVIHRDLKSSNVLLDLDMSPKISDFGLARLFAEDETHHVTGRVVGTFGYMAPEYARRGHVSMKVDVYSFGVLILEIVSGKRSNGFQYDSENSPDILSYIWEHWINGTALETIDPSMGDIFSSDEVLRCIQIALLCTQEAPTNRPPMSSVFLMLHGPLMALQEPMQPKFAARISTGSSSGSSKQTDLGSSEEFAGTLQGNVEDRHLIKQITWEPKRATRNMFFDRQTT